MTDFNPKKGTRVKQRGVSVIGFTVKKVNSDGTFDLTPDGYPDSPVCNVRREDIFPMGVNEDPKQINEDSATAMASDSEK